MTREDVNKLPICIKCKWCLPKTIDHTNWTEYQFYCKNNIASIDTIKGDETYMNCILINGDGKCDTFEEPKLTWFERFMAFMNKDKEKCLE